VVPCLRSEWGREPMARSWPRRDYGMTMNLIATQRPAPGPTEDAQHAGNDPSQVRRARAKVGAPAPLPRPSGVRRMRSPFSEESISIQRLFDRRPATRASRSVCSTERERARRRSPDRRVPADASRAD
jgi:hypothetical protein